MTKLYKLSASKRSYQPHVDDNDDHLESLYESEEAASPLQLGLTTF